eukprot:758302-Hanusia_phi.AAC.3
MQTRVLIGQGHRVVRHVDQTDSAGERPTVESPQNHQADLTGDEALSRSSRGSTVPSQARFRRTARLR